MLEQDPLRARGGRRPATSRADLEEVALGLFAQHGFDETSVDGIAAAAGISRRTFFHYYPSKTDLVWGDFSTQLDGMRAGLAAIPDDVPMMEAVRRAVVAFNRVPAGAEHQHRLRLGLILGVPTLLANSTLRFVAWRQVVADFAARRLGVAPDSLVPSVVGGCALGAAVAAYQAWLADPGADLAALLDEALAGLAAGFRVPGQGA